MSVCARFSIAAAVFTICIILLHEFGHGLMAQRLGGRIIHILLWPFGGLCYHTSPETTDSYRFALNMLKISFAGPFTHILVCFLVLFPISLLLTFGNFSLSLLTAIGASSVEYDACYVGGGGSSIMNCFVYILGSMNTNLFVFNVFYPMFPMDGIKILVSLLQVVFKIQPIKVARYSVVISASTILFVCIQTGLWGNAGGMFGLIGGGGAGGFGMIGAMLMIISAMETYQIYKLIERQQVHTHAIFANARSHFIPLSTRTNTMVTINSSFLDEPRTPQVSPPAAVSTVNRSPQIAAPAGVNTPARSEIQENRQQFIERIAATTTPLSTRRTGRGNTPPQRTSQQ